MSKVFLFTSTDHRVAYAASKVLSEYEKKDKEFYIVFDNEYSLFYHNSKLNNKFYTVTDKKVYENIILPNEVIHLDYNTHYKSIDRKISIKQWMCEIILGQNIQLDTVYYNTSIDIKLDVNKFIEECNKNNFSNVLYVPYCITDNWDKDFIRNDNSWNDIKFRSLPADIDREIHSFLANIVNVVKIYPDTKYRSVDLFYLVQSCDAVICNYDIVFDCANDLNKPCLVNLGSESLYERVSKTTEIFDPYRNEKRATPPELFKSSYNETIAYNCSKIVYSDVLDIYKKEILKMFKTNGVVYDSHM